jgi:hypothetical protein
MAESDEWISPTLRQRQTSSMDLSNFGLWYLGFAQTSIPELELPSGGTFMQTKSKLTFCTSVGADRQVHLYELVNVDLPLSCNFFNKKARLELAFYALWRYPLGKMCKW